MLMIHRANSTSKLLMSGHALDWSNLMSRQRYFAPNDWREVSHATSSARKQYHRDYDRIVFSEAFRRLSAKTQVHPLVDNDQVHDRLIHSLEVSCVGRTFGMRVGEWLEAQGELPQGVHPDDIGTVVQAACLAHDIGNPPFGHAGEDAIRDFFKSPEGQGLLSPLKPNQRAEFCSFEGNAQGLRVVSQLDPHRSAGGMRLTAATLGAFIKYPWTRDAASHGKYGVNLSEWEFVSELSEVLGLKSIDAHTLARHPLVYLVEAADDACYSVLDIEDAVEMGVIPFDQARDLWVDLIEPERFVGFENLDSHGFAYRARGVLIDQIEAATERGFASRYDAIMSGQWVGDIYTAGGDRVIQSLKAFASEHIYNSDRKRLKQSDAHAALARVLAATLGAVYERYLASRQRHYFSERSAQVLALLKRSLPEPNQSLYHQYQQVLDFVSGMTDRYLLEFDESLQNRSEGVPDRVQ